MRATVLTMAALERQGIDDPERAHGRAPGHRPDRRLLGAVHDDPRPARAVHRAELARIGELADERGDGLAFAPGGPYTGAWQDLAEADSWQAFCGDYPLDVCPPTDDKPFFFNMRRLGNILDDQAEGYHYGVDPYQILLATLGILVVLSVVGLLAPLRLVRSGDRPKVAEPPLLRRDRARVPPPRDRVDPAVRAVPRVPDLRAVGRVVRAARVHGCRVGDLSARALPAGRAPLRLLAVIVVLVVSDRVCCSPVLEALIDLPFAARVASPSRSSARSVRRDGHADADRPRRAGRLHHSSGVPFAWGVNGVASVVGSVFAVLIALIFGFTAVALTAAACYGVALLHAALGRWPEQPAAASEPQADVDNAMVASSSR